MIARPICEPVELPQGTSVVVDRVQHSAASPELGRLLHFHDVSELVLFDDVRGWFIADGRRYRLHPGSIIFAPSMRHHDFLLEAGRKSWWLIQIDPYVVEQFARQNEVTALAQPFCASAGIDACARLSMLAEWLRDAGEKGETARAQQNMLELLLGTIARCPAEGEVESASADLDVDRMLPAIEQLRRDPGATLSLPDAATLCSLSPAYFSRRFKQIFGMNYSDYARSYRLHIAARRLGTTRRSISAIAYELGFSSPAHFTQRFRERFGVAPRNYRRAMRGGKG